MAARLGPSGRASQTASGASSRSTPRFIAVRSHHTDSLRYTDDSRVALVAGLSTLAAGLLISGPANAALLGDSTVVASQPPERSRYVMLERQRLERLVVSEFEARLSELSDGELADMLEDMLRNRRAGISAADLMGRAGRPAPSTSGALTTSNSNSNSNSNSSQQQQQGSTRRGAADSAAPGQDSRQPVPAQGSGGGSGIDWLLSPLSDLRGQLAPEMSSETASSAVATSSAVGSTSAGSGGGSGMAGLFQGGLGLGGLMGGGGGAAPSAPGDAPDLPVQPLRASASRADEDALATGRARDTPTSAQAPFGATRDTYAASTAARDAAELGGDTGAGVASGAGTVAGVEEEDEEQDFTSQLMARLMGGQQPGPAAQEPPPPSPSSSAASGAGADAQRDALVAGMMGALGSALSQLPGAPGVEASGGGADLEASAQQQPQGPLGGLQLPSLQATQLPALPSIAAPSLPDVGPALEAAGAAAAGVAGVASGVAGGVRDLAEGIADGSVAEAAAQVLVPVGLVAAGTAGVVAISYLTEPPQQSSTATDAEQPQASGAASPPLAPTAAANSSRAAADAAAPPQQQAAQTQVAVAPEPGTASTDAAGGGLMAKLTELGSGLMSFARNTKQQQQSDATASSTTATSSASTADTAVVGRANASATVASTGLAAGEPSSGVTTATTATSSNSRASRLKGLLDNGPPLPLPGTPDASSPPLGGLTPGLAAAATGDGASVGVPDGSSGGGGGILWERSDEPASPVAAGPGPVLWQRAESTPPSVRGMPQARQAPSPPQPPRFPPPRPPPVMPSGGPAGGFGASAFGPDVVQAPQRIQSQTQASTGSVGMSFPVPPDPWRSEPAAAGAATAAAGVVSRAEGSQDRRETVASAAAGGDTAGSSPWDSPR